MSKSTISGTKSPDVEFGSSNLSVKTLETTTVNGSIQLNASQSKPTQNDPVYHKNHDVPDPDSIVKEPSSGFMLLSVRRMSKVKKEKQRDVLYSNGDDGVCELEAELNITDPSRDCCSPPSSASPVQDDRSEEFCRSGSIEAEEYEEYDEPEDEYYLENGAMQKDHTGFQQQHSKSVCIGADQTLSAAHNNNFYHLQLISQLESKISQTQSKSNTPIGEPDTITLTSPHSHSLRVVKPKSCITPMLVPAATRSSRLAHGSLAHCFQRDQCIYPQCPRESWRYAPYTGINDSSNVTYPDAMALSTHTTALQSQQMSRNTDMKYPNKMMHKPNNNAPASVNTDFSASEPPPISPQHCVVDPRLSPSWPALPSVLHPSNMHAPYHLGISGRSPLGSYVAPPITCLHHMHSSAPSDSHPSNLNQQPPTIHRNSETPNMTGSNLPPLQPASRFRKARIHETVQQWSHGRFSIHDCHLKAVPDWVLELLKKPLASEEAMATAMNKKIKCATCLVPKMSDSESSSYKTKNAIDSHSLIESHLKHMHPKLAVIEGALEARAVILSRGEQASSLFSFWDSGDRVNSRLPDLSHIRLNSPEVTMPCDTLCSYCTDSAKKQSPLQPPPAAVQDLYPMKQCGCFNDMTKHHADAHGQSSQYGLLSDNSSTRPPSLALNALDPATAYLRRHQFNAENQEEGLQSSNGLPRSGDSYSVGELSTVLSADSNTTHSLSKDVPDSFQSCSTTIKTHPDPVPDCNMHSRLNDHPTCSHEPLSSGIESSHPNYSEPTASPCDLAIRSPHLCNHKNSRPSGLPNGVHTVIPPNSDPTSTCKSATGRFSHPSRISQTDAHNVLMCSSNHPYPHPVSVDDDDDDDDDGIPPGRIKTAPKPSSTPSSPSMANPSTVIDFRPHAHHTCVNMGNQLKNQVNFHSFCIPCSGTFVRRDVLHNSDGTKRLCSSNLNYAQQSRPDGLFDSGSNDISQNGHGWQRLLPDRLEAQLHASVDAFRSNLVNTLRSELASLNVEKENLLLEISRLNNELGLLHGYQEAFYALRPFVTPDLWEQIKSQYVKPSDFQSVKQSSIPPPSQPPPPHESSPSLSIDANLKISDSSNVTSLTVSHTTN